MAVGAECYAQNAEVELPKKLLLCYISPADLYLFIGILDHESYNTDLLNSNYPAGSIINIILIITKLAPIINVVCYLWQYDTFNL